MNDYYDPRDVERDAAYEQESAAAGHVNDGWQEGDPCQVCGEDGDDADPLAHWVGGAIRGGYVMAHGQCGEDAGLTLA